MQQYYLRILIFIMCINGIITSHAQKYELIEEYSFTEWHAGSHYGLINFKEGEFQVQNNQIKKGLFILDFNTLTNIDIQNEQIKSMLVDHLKSSLYFDVEKHPYGILKIISSGNFNNTTDTFPVIGVITLKGNSREIKFNVKKEKNFFTTNITIDNLQDFFDGMSKSMIPDEILLKVHITSAESKELE